MSLPVSHRADLPDPRRGGPAHGGLTESACGFRPVVRGGCIPRSGLDFEQYSPDPAARASRDVRRADLACSRFSGMLWSLSPFRGPVSRMTQVRCPRASSLNEGYDIR